MKIYTKKGDRGTTFLFGGGPYPKDAERISAYGDVDELNSVLGCAITEIKDKTLREKLRALQEELFIVGAELATVSPSEKMRAGFVAARHIAAQEKWIDEIETKLQPLQKFILPGGSKGAALLHLARTVCRRAERSVVTLSHDQEVRSEILVYLNRLSDLLFVLARTVNLLEKEEDLFWEGILK
ncbi:MAG: cob(I)yrinic acid a,c-diamide adenosyltransferase [bacterium]